MTLAIAQFVHTMMIGFWVLGAVFAVLAVAVCVQALRQVEGR